MAKKKAGKSLPPYRQFFQPVLDALKELGGSGRPAEVKDIIISKLGFSDEQLSKTNESGETTFSNRVDWARFYLVRAGYLDSSTRGVRTLTDRGRRETITVQLAREIASTVKRDATKARKAKQPESRRRTAGESVDKGLFPQLNHRPVLKHILLNLPPDGFERLCQRLLRESGFEQVNVTGRSGDGGIDGNGVVQVNRLVTFKVLFQCKRYAGSVGAPQVRDFQGAMFGRAEKGIILTTGTFTRDAKDAAARDGAPPVELVDGEELLDMFESLELGVRRRTAYEVDESFFEQFATG